MLTLINGIDRTSQINPTTIRIQSTINDPMSQATFEVKDKGSNFLVKGLNEIVMLDENALTNQTINMLLNPNWDSTGGGAGVVWLWNIVNSFTTAPTITYTPNPTGVSSIEIDLTPTASIGSYTYTQRTLLGTAVAGQSYMLSVQIQNIALSNAKTIASITYTDANGVTLATFQSNASGSSTSKRMTVSGLAPAGTAFATVSFGVQATSATNGGQVIFSNAQFEPMLFVKSTAYPVSYPTPLCNHLQANCRVLPNSYTVRQQRLFAGYVSNSDREYTGVNRKFQVKAFQLIKLLDATVFSGIFSGMTDFQMIQAIMANAVYVVHPMGANVPTITMNNVVATTILPTMSWDTQSILKALNNISDINGCSVYVDHYGDLHSLPNNYSYTTFGLSDTPDNVATFAYSDLKVSDDYSQPKGRVTIVGGTYTPTWTDDFIGNGTTKQFTITQTTAQTPLTLTVSGSSQKIGINGTNTFAQGYAALMDTTNNFIVFNVAPAASAAIEVIYSYQAPVKVRTWALDAINQTYGIAFDAAVSDSTIITPQTALQRGVGETKDFAFSREVVTFTTQQPVIAGQVVPVTSVLEGWSALPLLVQSAIIVPKGGGLVEYQVKAGDYIPDIIAILKSMVKVSALNNLNSTNAASLPYLQDDITYPEYITFADSYTVTAHTQTVFYYGNASSLYGYSMYG